VAPYKGKYANIAMNGKEVYKFATRKVPVVIEEALANAGMGVEQVDWLLLHQANIRIMDVVADRLGMSKDKVRANQSKDAISQWWTDGDQPINSPSICDAMFTPLPILPNAQRTHTDPDEPVGVRQHERRLHPSGPG
jgi:hypothetical protein